MIIEDAHKQVDAEMNSLQSDVKQKHATFRRNLQEIRKVEKSRLLVMPKFSKQTSMISLFALSRQDVRWF